MGIKNTRIDIRMVKYENYIKNNPHKPYGYYCMGKIQIYKGFYKKAESYFNNTLELDKNFVRAVIGLIEVYMYQGKHLKAVYLYNRYSNHIKNKNIYTVKLVRAVSSLYNANKLNPSEKRIISRLVLNHIIKSVYKILKRQPNNPVLNLILCMNFLYSHEKNKESYRIYMTCINMDGLDNNLRYSLVQILSRMGIDILHNDQIASKFSDIPSSECKAEYVNRILKAAIKSGKINNAKKMLNSIGISEKSIPLSSLWMFIYWSREYSIYDKQVLQCCRKLLKSGWVDKLVAQTFFILKELSIARHTDNEDRILKLYGYNMDNLKARESI